MSEPHKHTSEGPAEPPHWHERVARGLVRRSLIVLYLTCLVSLVSFGAAHSHWLELSSHFRPHYFVVLALGSSWLLCTRRWRHLLPVLLCGTVSGSDVLPWYLPVEDAPRSAQGSELRLLLANVMTTNKEHERVLALIERERPDVVVLLEVNQRWLNALQAIESEYPNSVKKGRSDNFGIAVYSRLPIPDLRSQDFVVELPSVMGTLRLGEREVRLIATHPLPPVTSEYFHVRNEQLAEVARSVAHDSIVIGDLNTTMWSPYYKRFEAESGLRNARRGFGILPSWPVGLGPLKIPLDHCLVSSGISVQDLRIAEDIGGDHLPLIVDLLVPGPD